MTRSSLARAASCAARCVRRCTGPTSPTSGISSASSCAFRTSLPPRLSELAILVTARACNCQVEWYIHEMMARKAGLAGAVIDDLRVGRRPSALDADERVIYDYADALNRTRHVPEAIYRRALERWDVVGVVELTALIGYYTMVAMTLNAHEIPLPDGAAPPLEPVAA